MKSLNEHKQSLNEQKAEKLRSIDETFKKEFDEIKDHFYKHFPNGSAYVGFQQIVGAPHLSINFRLIGDVNDIPHRITRNDPWYAGFIGFTKGYRDYDYIPTKDVVITLEGSSTSYYIKPDPSTYLAMQRVKVPFRKKTATMDKLVKSVKDYITKVANSMIENKDNFMDDVDTKKYVDTIRK